jgi:hypothetical protein
VRELFSRAEIVQPNAQKILVNGGRRAEND